MSSPDSFVVVWAGVLVRVGWRTHGRRALRKIRGTQLASTTASSGVPGTSLYLSYGIVLHTLTQISKGANIYA